MPRQVADGERYFCFGDVGCVAAGALADQAALVQAQVAVDRIRDKLIGTEHHIHGQVSSSKDAVRGQFGDDSEEIASMGLKRASERKRGGGKAKPAAE